ncbi:MAG: hypothetical protein HFJ24_01580 [Clostridia bacterium]|nr:hypothetical protein [Clostridia bacterium]MCI9274748.1 hypothetical protein [Clostridia bacterium]
MKWVLLFFCGILGLMLLLLLLIISAKIKLNIQKFYISNIERDRRLRKINKEILMYLEIYLFGFIKIAKIRLTKELFKKISEKQDLTNIEKDAKIIKKIKPIKVIKRLRPKLEKLKLYLAIGTENVMLTVNLVTLISSLIRNKHTKCRT